MARCLSFQANYRCRHSGVCCRTSWPLPFEPVDRENVERLHLVSGRAFREGEGVSFAERRPDGACVFLESREERHLCRIHAAAGQTILPVTCRMFPRIVLEDARGTVVTLSHYCPTAASLLFEFDGPVDIVDAPSSLIDVGPLDGLDARDAIPPLLRDGVLMDLESFDAWERFAVATLASGDLEPVAAVDRLESVTREIARWSPGDVPLLEAVHRATKNGDSPLFSQKRTPQFLRHTNNGGCPLFLGRWLAAHLFGNWIAYQGRGLLTIVRYVRACLDIFTIEFARDANALEAIRRSDFLIVHEADSQQLATALDSLLRTQRRTVLA